MSINEEIHSSLKLYRLSVKIFLFYEHQRRNSLLIEIISVRCGNPAPAKKQNCFTSIVHYNINPRVGINKGVWNFQISNKSGFLIRLTLAYFRTIQQNLMDENVFRMYCFGKRNEKSSRFQTKWVKSTSPSGGWTWVSSLTGGDTHHYTNEGFSFCSSF